MVRDSSRSDRSARVGTLNSSTASTGQQQNSSRMYSSCDMTVKARYGHAESQLMTQEHLDEHQRQTNTDSHDLPCMLSPTVGCKTVIVITATKGKTQSPQT